MSTMITNHMVSPWSNRYSFTRHTRFIRTTNTDISCTYFPSQEDFNLYHAEYKSGVCQEVHLHELSEAWEPAGFVNKNHEYKWLPQQEVSTRDGSFKVLGSGLVYFFFPDLQMTIDIYTHFCLDPNGRKLSPVLSIKGLKESGLKITPSHNKFVGKYREKSVQLFQDAKGFPIIKAQGVPSHRRLIDDASTHQLWKVRRELNCLRGMVREQRKENDIMQTRLMKPEVSPVTMTATTSSNEDITSGIEVLPSSVFTEDVDRYFA